MLKAVKKSFAVESFGVSAYWDSRGTTKVTSIYWGELSPGSTCNVDIFVRNEEATQPCFVYLWTKNWSPPQAASYITLSWDHGREVINPEEMVPVTLTLRIARSIHGVTDFDFNIVILGTKYLAGDANRDGLVDIYDAVMLASAYGSTPSDHRWEPQADFNSDNIIDIYDATMLTANYGLSVVV